MGGNALKHLDPLRLASKDVLEIGWRVQRIADCYPGMTARPVPWVLDKESHGDVDVLVSHEGNDDSVVQDFFRQLGPALKVGWPPDRELVHINDKVMSLGIPWKSSWNGQEGRVQLDLIQTPHQEMRHAMVYYAGGGLGMMLGRIASHYGYVFGTDGLRLRADPDVPWMEDILLTNDPGESLAFLGYRPIDVSSFRAEEDLWTTVLANKRAHPWMFIPEGTNAHNRHRDKVRPAFVRFQRWIAETYPIELTGPRPTRWTWTQAANNVRHARLKYAGSIDEHLTSMEQEWNEVRSSKAFFGANPARAALSRAGIVIEEEQNKYIGAVINRMKMLLPHEDEHRQLFRYRNQHPELTNVIARAADWAVRFTLAEVK